MLGEGQEKGKRERKKKGREEKEGKGREEREGEGRGGEREKKGEEGEERDFASFNVLREQVAITSFIKHWPLITAMFHNVLCDKRGGAQSPAESKARCLW